MEEVKKLKKKASAFCELVRLIARLRGEDGCPWDRKQTPESMRVYILEEVHELLEAIDSRVPAAICEELGDVMFQVLFLTHIFEERGYFDIGDVARRSTEKMVRRHPHVFGDLKVTGAEDVRMRWHEFKKGEPNHDKTKSLVDTVPRNLPGLLRAYRLTERVARVGFDWPNLDGVIAKAKEEWAELQQAIDAKDQNRIASEIGDLLFAIVNLSRFVRVHPDSALRDAIRRFENRFRYIEETLSKKGHRMEKASLEQMDALWEEAKQLEKKKQLVVNNT